MFVVIHVTNLSDADDDDDDVHSDDLLITSVYDPIIDPMIFEINQQL